MTQRLTHEDLRKWGEALDRAMPKGHGERLLSYADDWRADREELMGAINAMVEDGWMFFGPEGPSETQGKVLVIIDRARAKELEVHGTVTQ